MPKRSKVRAPVDRGRALSLLFRGYSARKAGEELRTTNVTVSNILKRFIVEAEEVGVLDVAVKYNIGEHVGKLIGIGAAVESTGVDASRAPLGLRIVKAVKDFGVEEDDAPAFIEACYAEAIKQKVEPGGFVKTIHGLQGWYIGDRSDYQNLLDVVESKNGEYDSLVAKVDDYTAKAEAAEARLRKAVADEGTTVEELDQFTALRDELKPYGLDLGNVEAAKNCIVKIREKGDDSEAVVSFYSENVNWEENLKLVQEQHSSIAGKNLEVSQRLKTAEGILAKKSEMVKKVRKAEELGIEPSQLGVVVEMAREVGARHGLDIKESISWLAKDLKENWEPKLGFENEKVAMEEKLSILEERIELAEGKERVALEKTRAQEQALSGLAELSKHVSPPEIIEFKRIIVDSGQDVPTFRAEMERLGSVTALVDMELSKRKEKTAKLKAEQTILSNSVAQLQKQKTALEADIETLHSEAIVSLREAYASISNASNVLVNDFVNPETGYEATIKRLGKEAREEMKDELYTQKEALQKSFEAAAKQIDKYVADAEKLRKDTWNTGKLLGFNLYLIRLAKLIGGEQLTPVEAVSAMKMAVDAFYDWQLKHGLQNMYPSTQAYSVELRRLPK